MAVELSLSGEALGEIDHPLANAMFAFAVPNDDRQRRLLERVLDKTTGTSPHHLLFEDPQRYYVSGLTYLPFLARAGLVSAPWAAPADAPIASGTTGPSGKMEKIGPLRLMADPAEQWVGRHQQSGMWVP